MFPYDAFSLAAKRFEFFLATVYQFECCSQRNHDANSGVYNVAERVKCCFHDGPLRIWVQPASWSRCCIFGCGASQ